MRVIDQSHKIISITPEPLKAIEYAARNCYRSQHKITDDSAPKFVEMLIRRGHETPLEFATMTVELVTDRGVMAEITRHRAGVAFCVESSRYCNYGKDHIEFVRPVWFGMYNIGDFSDPSYEWYKNCKDSETYYTSLLIQGQRPEQARQVLNMSLATNICMIANFREWRHIFRLRTSKHAHPQMRALMLGLLEEAKVRVPVVFDNLIED